jgi:hypothetical protein
MDEEKHLGGNVCSEGNNNNNNDFINNDAECIILPFISDESSHIFFFIGTTFICW